MITTYASFDEAIAYIESLVGEGFNYRSILRGAFTEVCTPGLKYYRHVSIEQFWWTVEGASTRVALIPQGDHSAESEEEFHVEGGELSYDQMLSDYKYSLGYIPARLGGRSIGDMLENYDPEFFWRGFYDYLVEVGADQSDMTPR